MTACVLDSDLRPQELSRLRAAGQRFGRKGTSDIRRLALRYVLQEQAKRLLSSAVQ